jgi:LPXTG-motif cell wall-anchored protein
VVVPPVSRPTQAQQQSAAPVLPNTGARAQSPLVLGTSLLLAGAMLLAAGLPGRRWRIGLRAARTLWAGGRH